MNDKEVILAALQRERDELHDKIMQVDRIIKRVKSVDYTSDEITMGDNTKQIVPISNTKEVATRPTGLINKSSY